MEIIILKWFTDLRETYDIVKENEEWSNWNQLYKTLWFANNAGIDVEFCDAARASYSCYPFYKKNAYNGGKRIIINGVELTADLMNGWWGPFKLMFPGIKSRTVCFDEIKKESSGINPDSTDEEYFKWLKDKFKYECSWEEYKEFINFLSVVYTIGNITPAAVNPRANYLDNWEYKLHTHALRWANMMSCSDKNSKSLFECFCKNHFYNGYLELENNGEWEKLINNDWFKKKKKDYFQTQYSLIEKRGKILEAAGSNGVSLMSATL